MSEWIEHDGGECPVDGNTRVDVRWFNLPENESYCASMKARYVDADCVADWSAVTNYRIVEPKQEQSTAIVDLRDRYGQRVETVAQDRQHVSDAAWEALSYRFGLQKRDVANAHYRNGGVVVLTVAEHDALLDGLKFREEQWRFADYEHRKERDALRAEVERLRCELRLQDRANDILTRDNERLRKGVMQAELVGRHDKQDAVAGAASAKTRDCLDYSGGGRVSVPVEDIVSSPRVQQQVKHVERLRKERDESASVACPGSMDRRDTAWALLGGAERHDHRLGHGLPDGEPCEPMSARSWRRST